MRQLGWYRRFPVPYEGWKPVFYVVSLYVFYTNSGFVGGFPRQVGATGPNLAVKADHNTKFILGSLPQYRPCHEDRPLSRSAVDRPASQYGALPQTGCLRGKMVHPASESKGIKIPMPKTGQNDASGHRKTEESKFRCLKQAKTVRRGIGKRRN